MSLLGTLTLYILLHLIIDAQVGLSLNTIYSLILSANAEGTVLHPLLLGFHIRKDLLPLVLGVPSADSSQLSAPSELPGLQRPLPQGTSPHPVAALCVSIKAWKLSPTQNDSTGPP